jgi:hypothetical protein
MFVYSNHEVKITCIYYMILKSFVIHKTLVDILFFNNFKIEHVFLIIQTFTKGSQIYCEL